MPCPAPLEPAAAGPGSCAAAALKPACQGPPSPTPGQPCSIHGGSREAPSRSTQQRGPSPEWQDDLPKPWRTCPSSCTVSPTLSLLTARSSLACAQAPARLRAFAPTVPSASSPASGWNVTSCTLSPTCPSPPLPWLHCFQRSYHVPPVSCMTSYTCLFSIHAPL